MTKDTNTPQPAGSLRAIFNKAMTAYFDLFNNPPGVGKPYIDAKRKIQDEAEAAITALIEGAAPAKRKPVDDFPGPVNPDEYDDPAEEDAARGGLHTGRISGWNNAIEQYRANLLRALNGKEQE